MSEESRYKYSQEYDMPRQRQKAFPVSIPEWHFLKEQVTKIKESTNPWKPWVLVFLGAFLAGLLGLPLISFKNNVGEWQLWSFVCLFATTMYGILSLVFFIVGLSVKKSKKRELTGAIDFMSLIEDRSKTDEENEKSERADETPVEPDTSEYTVQLPTTSKQIFYEDFSKFEGWHDYLKGTVEHSTEFCFKDKFCLKKDSNADPHGGYKLIDPIGLNTVLKGSIYRPFDSVKKFADRLALENRRFCGYGFCVSHGINRIMIEQRTVGLPSSFTSTIFETPKNSWYFFEFYLYENGAIFLQINNSNKEKIVEIGCKVNMQVRSFDRISIHGGFPYYVTDLSLEKFDL